MIHNKFRYILTLVALFAMTAGAWAGVTPVSVAGSFQDWDPTGNEMTYADGIYSITINDVPAGENQFKFALDHSWATSFGTTSASAVELNKTLEASTTGDNIKFTLTEASDVTFSFKFGVTDTYMISTTGLLVGQTPPLMSLSSDGLSATMEMPASDVTVDYELVRDMAYKVTAKMDDRIRIKKDGNGFVFADVEKRNPVVVDSIDALNPDTLVYGDKKDYDSLQIQQKVDGLWVPIEMNYKSNDWLVVDTFRYVVRGCENYDGIAFSNEFVFYEGYPVKIPAKEFVTYYRDEALGLLDEEYQAGAALYTITAVADGKATATLLDITNPQPPLLQIAPANTPLLIYNSSDDTLEIKLIPTTTSTTINYYSYFTGVLEPTTLTGDDGFYAFNGKQFVYVRKDLTLPANKCCLKIKSNSSDFVSGARAINIVFEEATGIRSIDNGQLTIDNDVWYDLSGRRVTKPTMKGVYIQNGKKVIIK